MILLMERVMNISYKVLKARHRAERENYSQNLSLRVHRALSWLDKSEQCDDLDTQFITLWIAFNAAYANEIHDRATFPEVRLQAQFIKRICGMDKADDLYNLIWSDYTTSIRALLNNKFIYQPFWDFHNQKISEEEWGKRFYNANESVKRALSRKSTSTMLLVILSRLYTLRNQLVHGGATWNGGANREQIRDGVKILGKLVPLLINIMMDGHREFWGEACYPVID